MSSITEVEVAIQNVERKVEEVERKVEEVERRVEASEGDPQSLQYWRTEKEQLRRKEERAAYGGRLRGNV
jgi:hypothetical protein